MNVKENESGFSILRYIGFSKLEIFNWHLIIINFMHTIVDVKIGNFILNVMLPEYVPKPSKEQTDEIVWSQKTVLII